MKNKLLRNIPLKIFSIIGAIVIWILIVNIDDPVVTQKYSEINVSILNESIILNQGKVFQITNNSSKVDVYIRAKRSILKNIRDDNIVCTADLEDMSVDGIVPIDITLSRYENQISEAFTRPANMIISVENSVSKKFPVNIVTNGDPAKGYFISDKTSDVDTVTVSGPESLIKQIDKVNVSVNTSNNTKEMSYTVYPYYTDADGNRIASDMISSDVTDTGIAVTIKILKAKTVPIVIEESGHVAAGYTIDKITTTPEKIDIIGTVQKMESVEQIVVSGSEVDVTGFNTTMEKTIDIKKYLPDGIELASYEDGTIAITVTISPYGTKELEYPVGSIIVNNSPYGMKVDYGTLKTITLNLAGNKSDIDSLKEKDLKVILDIRTCKELGDYTIAVSIISDKSIKLASETKVDFSLVKD